MSNAAAAMRSPITVTLPDGSTRTTTSTTVSDLAREISTSLGKAALVARINGELKDLSTELQDGDAIEIITRKSDEALEIIRHDCAHVLAEAVQRLFPGTQVTIGPAITDGFYYDFARDEAFTPDDFSKIEAEMHRIVKENKPFERQTVSRADAIKLFKEKGETYKVELINDLPEGEDISLYTQGEWIDLCRGPHAPSTKHVGKAFKLMKVAGAYWRGNSDNAMLQRIYATAWRDQAELDAHLMRLEEAEKRDHRRLGKQMDLFHFQDEAPGQPFWHHNGWQMYRLLLDYMRTKLVKYGYQEINTPQLLDSRFWKASGHWDKYHENMFVFNPESDHPAALKPMSCPGGAQVYAADVRSYRDLPLRISEFGKVFRKEASGARHGLMRVQAFTQDDAHVFCTDEQLEDEVIAMVAFMREVYGQLGFDDFKVRFATRPDERIGGDADWDRAEAALESVCKTLDLDWELNAGDGAFYAPKLDFYVRDSIGREWQCCTIQVDMNMPERLGLSYIDDNSEKRKPHMIHRAIYGSVERFMGVYIEHTAGHFPLWLAPVQAVVSTITNDSDAYAKEVCDQLRAAGIRTELDRRSEKISYKIREHSLRKVPIILALGGRESENQTVTVRRLGSDAQETMGLDAFLKSVRKEAEMPGLL